MKLFSILMALLCLSTFTVFANESNLAERGEELAKKFEDFRRSGRISFVDDSAKDDYRDAEDELEDFLKEVADLESEFLKLTDNKTQEAFEKLSLYRMVLSELVVDKTISGPVLAQANVEFTLSAGVDSVLREVSSKLGVVVGTSGRVQVRSKDIRQTYQKARSAVLSQLSECIQLTGGVEVALDDARTRETITYLRQYNIISQPECVAMLGKTQAAFDACR